jgi:acetolactate synthase I/II/III large subunit
MPRMTTAEALVESLVRHGLQTVYGLPGMHNDPLFDALFMAKNRLRTIHTRHEQSAAYMALGAALVTGKPQAYSVVPGPGFLSSSAALLTAFGMNAPVLALVGQIWNRDIDRGHGWLHEIRDQKGIAAHITKFAARIGSPHEAPGLVRDALAAACSGRQRPVFLECALDIWGQRGEVAFPDMPTKIEPPPVDADAVDAAAKVMGAAKNPLIVVGGGAQDASTEITALAEMLQAPVVAYRRGRGVVASSHPLSTTIPIGHRLWANVDVVMAIGTRFMMQHNEWGIDSQMKIVRLDIDPEEPSRLRKPDVALVGDAATVVGALLNRLPSFNSKRTTRTEEMNGHRAWLAERFKDLQPQVAWLEAIRKVLPPDGIFVDEVTQAGFAARVAFPVERPRTFLSPGYQDNLGWGLGTALGAKSAKPDVPVVLISGDGGFLFQLGELATAVQHNIAVIMIVFDNQMYGNVHRLQREMFGGRHIACELQNPDFVALAESFNMAGFRATSAAELEDALRRAIDLNAPALIHVPHAETGNPWPFIRMPRVRG